MYEPNLGWTQLEIQLLSMVQHWKGCSTPKINVGIAWYSVLCEKYHSVYVVKGLCSLLTRALISKGSLLVAAGCDYWTASMLGYGATVYGFYTLHRYFLLILLN